MMTRDMRKPLPVTRIGHVIPFEECLGREDESGGKAIGLAKLILQGLPVPAGFCVTTGAYLDAVTNAGLGPRLAELLDTADHRSDNTDVSGRIEELFESIELPAELVAHIKGAYEGLGDDEFVAVRSSATAEDTADASFAGQQETFLYVQGADSVVHHVVRCWASLFSARAIGYRAKLNIDTSDLAMAVVVQRMIPAKAAGVMMTLHPVTGDRSCIFIEAGHGLGEGIVRGEVGVDNFELDKQSLQLVSQTINPKPRAYRFVPEEGTVALIDVASDQVETPCLDVDQIRALGELGRQVEEAFGMPMDIEWAIDDDIHLLQARPETVWQHKPEPVPHAIGAAFDPHDPRDPLHSYSPDHVDWTTSNIGEAMPGVMTPLGWTFWGCGESAFRNAIADMGILTEAERKVPESKDEWILRAFFGRIAWQVSFFATVGDRMPGTSAEEVAKSLLGRVPHDLPSSPTKRFYPRIVRGMAKVVVTSPRETREAAARTQEWYREIIPRIPQMRMEEIREALAEAERSFELILTAQGHVTFAVIQPLYDALQAVVNKYGAGDAGILSGSGGAELTGMLTDMWEASRGRLSMDELLLRVGFHGPREGEVSSTTWREDPAPLVRMLAEYREFDDEHSPAAKETKARQAWAASAEELLAVVPRWQRPLVRRFIRLAARQIPLRGVAKRGMLQSIDVARAAARRAGELLVAEGLLDEIDDVFYLTLDELRGTVGAEAKELVIYRRARRAQYLELVTPNDWRGMPEPITDQASTSEGHDALHTVSGIGVSRGIVEGRAKVLLSVDFGDVEPGEILVAPTTDPSWASIMFVSAGLVVDIGGALSHAALVARELALPCVVNTQNGTKTIQNGDLLRVDGTTGTVEILARAGSPGPQHGTGDLSTQDLSVADD